MFGVSSKVSEVSIEGKKGKIYESLKYRIIIIITATFVLAIWYLYFAYLLWLSQQVDEVKYYVLFVKKETKDLVKKKATKHQLCVEHQIILVIGSSDKGLMLGDPIWERVWYFLRDY